MTRLANELRAVTHLARLGYSLQACSLVAGLYEIALTIVYIGTDNQRATTWLDHMDPLKSPWSVGDLTKEAVAKLGGEPQYADSLYRVYSQFCMVKHGHPQVEIQQVTRLAPNEIELADGPSFTERSQRSAWFGLVHGTRLALMTQGQYTLDHVPVEGQRVLLDRRADLDAIAARLNQQAVSRWPDSTGDPFPGRWKQFTGPK